MAVGTDFGGNSYNKSIVCLITNNRMGVRCGWRFAPIIRPCLELGAGPVFGPAHVCVCSEAGERFGRQLSGRSFAQQGLKVRRCDAARQFRSQHAVRGAFRRAQAVLAAGTCQTFPDLPEGGYAIEAQAQ